MRCAITGAADGIGRALALRFARSGFEVVGIDRDRERSTETLKELEAIGAPAPSFSFADLACPDDWDRVLDELANGPTIDVFIHNAGINHSGRFEAIALHVHRQVLTVNLTAPLVLTAGLLKRKLLKPGGSLAFVSSLSHYVGYPGAAVYAASKDGVASYARSLSAALANDKIHVLTVFPGPTRTLQARRNSPDNRREARRMPPEALAERIFRAIEARKPVLVPGVANRLMACLGRFAPALANRAMTSLFLKHSKV